MGGDLTFKSVKTLISMWNYMPITYCDYTQIVSVFTPLSFDKKGTL